MLENDSLTIEQPVTAIPGIGAARERYLAKLGVRTIGDFLWLQPRRYLDFRRVSQPAFLRPKDQATVRGLVGSITTRRTRRRGVWLHEATLSCKQGQMLLVWFLPTPNKSRLPINKGENVVVAGSVSEGPRGLQMVHPLLQPDHAQGCILPVYPLVQGLYQKQMREWTSLALSLSSQLADPLPSRLRAKHQLLSLAESLHELHYPTSPERLKRARQRLAYDELFVAIIATDQRRKKRRYASNAHRCGKDGAVVHTFLSQLPYTLSPEQEAAIADIRSDMQKEFAMQRLLYGDVGTGKTVVAMYAAVKAVENGLQTAFLVPTRLLAEQHYRRWHNALGKAGVRVGLLLGDDQDGSIRNQIACGEVDLVIGTHALLEATYSHLGLLVVDEQQRFGVEQRRYLAQRWPVHSLYLTATPIPRSLALILWGDLDISLMSTALQGRSSVLTRWVSPQQREKLYAFLRKQVEQGGQAYVVFPRIEADNIPVPKNSGDEPVGGHTIGAIQGHKRLSLGALAGLEVHLLHGQMPVRAQEAIMSAFHTGDIDVLVSTTVIEVGVDVPNATTMIIEGADMFGLAQLHQLRGRVGRGCRQSYCLAVADPKTQEAVQRLRAFCSIDDGFALAEQDLVLRGPGELFGIRQSGYEEFRFTVFPTHLPLVQIASDDAQELLAKDPELRSPENASLLARLQEVFPSLASE